MNSPWDSFYEIERSWINSMQGLVPPPVRVEEIKECWADIRDEFARQSIDGQWLIQDVLDMVPPILFEQIKYGETWVIEAEGVIVERVAWK